MCVCVCVCVVCYDTCVCVSFVMTRVHVSFIMHVCANPLHEVVKGSSYLATVPKLGKPTSTQTSLAAPFLKRTVWKLVRQKASFNTRPTVCLLYETVQSIG
jgi:hypothetical protein